MFSRTTLNSGIQRSAGAAAVLPVRPSSRTQRWSVLIPALHLLHHLLPLPRTVTSAHIYIPPLWFLHPVATSQTPQTCLKLGPTGFVTLSEWTNQATAPPGGPLPWRRLSFLGGKRSFRGFAADEISGSSIHLLGCRVCLLRRRLINHPAVDL